VTGTNGVKKNSARKKENFSAKKKKLARPRWEKKEKKKLGVFFFHKVPFGHYLYVYPSNL
jgi:hypothetical protein